MSLMLVLCFAAVWCCVVNRHAATRRLQTVMHRLQFLLVANRRGTKKNKQKLQVLYIVRPPETVTPKAHR